jgi:hypothetical protein
MRVRHPVESRGAQSYGSTEVNHTQLKPGPLQGLQVICCMC